MSDTFSKVEVVSEFTIEAGDDLLRLQALRPHVRRGGNKDADCRLIGHLAASNLQSIHGNRKSVRFLFVDGPRAFWGTFIPANQLR